MKSFAFFHEDCTIPSTGIASAAPHMASVKSTITLNKDFTATSCCGYINELPFQGYAAQLNWIDEKQSIGQVELVAGILYQKVVNVRIDWQPPNSSLQYQISAPLPDWAWAAMFSAGTVITLQIKEGSGVLGYAVSLENAFGNLFNAGWKAFPVNYNRIVVESLLVGTEDDCKATFNGLDASFKLGFADPNGIQYSISERGGDHSLNFGDVHNAFWRITGEESNADQIDLWPASDWKFSQRSP